MPSEEDIPLIDRRRLNWSTNQDHLLGEGSFGIVYRGRFNGSPAAIKILKRPAYSNNLSQDYHESENSAMKQHRREIRRFEAIRNAYIIQYYAVFRDVDPRDLYIVTEYLQGGSLYSSLTKMRARGANLDTKSALQIALHIAYGLNHVHEENYTHGDMKPHNVLLTSEFTFREIDNNQQLAQFSPSAKAKIADFGLSKRLSGSNHLNMNTTIAFSDGPCGTFLYMSPEAYNGVNSLSDDEAKASDVYAFGLVLFELFSGLLCWKLEGVKNPMQLFNLVGSGQRPSWGARRDEVDAKYVNLVEQCWARDPTDRPRLHQIVRTLEKYSHQLAGGLVSNTSVLPIFDPTENEQDQDPIPYRRSPIRFEGQTISSAPSSQKDSESPMLPVPSLQLKSVQSVKPQNNVENEEKITQPLPEKVATFNYSNVHELSACNLGKDISNVESNDLTDSQTKELLKQSNSPTSGSRIDDDDEEKRMNNVPNPNESQLSSYRRSCVDDSDSYGDDSAEDEVDEEYHESERHEIDQTYIGDTKVVRVESKLIQPPPISQIEISDMPIEENSNKAEDALLGVGGKVNQNQKDALLNSFLNAAEAKQTETVENENLSLSPNHINLPGNLEKSDDGNSPSKDSAPERAPEFPVFQTNEQLPTDNQELQNMYPKTNNLTPDHPSTQSANGRSYSSPNVDIDPEEFQELTDIDRRALSASTNIIPHTSMGLNDMNMRQQFDRNQHRVPGYNYVPTQNNPQVSTSITGMNLHSIPNPSSGGQSIHQLAQHQQQYPSVVMSNNYGSANTHTSFSLGASQLGNGPLVSDQLTGGYIGSATPSGNIYWNPNGTGRSRVNMNIGVQQNLGGQNYAGIMDTTSGMRPNYGTINHQFGGHPPRSNRSTFLHGLSRAAGGGGEEELQHCRNCLNENIDPEARRDPEVAVKVCTEIGKIASNNPTRIGRSAVTETLPTIVSVMHAYNRHPYSQGQVYAACNYAICNLLKVSNEIASTELRQIVASWIGYTILWNICRKESQVEDFVVPVGHTAAAAARNFMWTNEDNVRAFAERRPNMQSSPTAGLINSLVFYNKRNDKIVVEATLAALTTLIYYPQQREEFVQNHGIDALLEVLEKYYYDVKMNVLIFAEITVLFSASNINHKESLEKGLKSERATERIIQILLQILEIRKNEKEELESIGRGLEALLTISRFSESLLLNVADNGSVAIVIRLLRSITSGTKSNTHDGNHLENADDGKNIEARLKVGKIACALMKNLAADQKWKLEIHKNDIVILMERLKNIAASEESVLEACSEVIQKLGL